MCIIVWERMLVIALENSLANPIELMLVCVSCLMIHNKPPQGFVPDTVISYFSWSCGLSRWFFCLFHLCSLMGLHSAGTLAGLKASRWPHSRVCPFMLVVSYSVVPLPCGLLSPNRLDWPPSMVVPGQPSSKHKLRFQGLSWPGP